MTNSSSHSLRLAELNAEILALELERTELLRLELSNAETRASEVAAFIGVYSASSSLGGASAVVSKKAKKKAKKKATSGNKPGRPSKKKSSKSKTPRGKASAGDRLQQLTLGIRGAGKDGISAKKLSDTTGIPYSAIRKIISENKQFVQKGEKRASRIFLK